MINVGIDVGKRFCQAALKAEDGKLLDELRFENTSQGIDQLLKHITVHGREARAVLESTGNYWIRVHDILEEHVTTSRSASEDSRNDDARHVPRDGVSVINRKRRASGILVDVDGDYVLLDAGPGIAQALADMEYPAPRIRFVFLTHLHLDHTHENATLVNDRAFATREPLNVYGPRGLEKHSIPLFRQLYSDVASTLRCYDYLRVKEAMQGPGAREENWHASCALTEHADGIAYRIEK